MSYRGPLPSSYVETLFTTLTVAWGSAFTDQWRGVDLNLVKADWARQLGGFYEPKAEDGAGDAPAVRWAMEHLPEKPVNVMGFRKLCATYFQPEPTALPSPPRKPPASIARAFEAAIASAADDRPEAVRWADRYLSLKAERPPRNDTERGHYERALRIMQQWNANKPKGAGQ